MVEQRWVEVGKIGRPHGVRGELSVIPFNEGSEIWEDGLEVSLQSPGKPARLVTLQQVRWTPKNILVRLEGVDDREEAGKLVHAVLSVPRDVLPDLDDGEYYHFDVVGAVVLDADSGLQIGKVREIGSTNIDLLEIDLDAGGRVTVPVLSEYVVSIGEEPGKVVVRNLEHWLS